MPSVDFPEDSIQSVAASGPWWETDDSKELTRGQLVWAHVQFFDEIPLQLIPTRDNAREHGSAILRAEPLRANQRRAEHESLPVAALPRRDGADGFVVNRAKRRPCLILAGAVPTRILDRDSKGQPNWTVAPFALAAPYYSADQSGRAGYRPALVEGIRQYTMNRKTSFINTWWNKSRCGRSSIWSNEFRRRQRFRSREPSRIREAVL